MQQTHEKLNGRKDIAWDMEYVPKEESAKHASAFAAMPHESEIVQGLFSNPLGKTIHGMIWEKCPSISGNAAVLQSNHIGFGLQNSFREQPFKSERTTKQMGTLIGKARKNKSRKSPFHFKNAEELKKRALYGTARRYAIDDLLLSSQCPGYSMKNFTHSRKKSS